MTFCSIKIFKTFKTNCCQQHWLHLKKVMAPLKKNENKNCIIANNSYTQFERSCGTFRVGGGENPMLLARLGQFAGNFYLKKFINK